MGILGITLQRVYILGNGVIFFLKAYIMQRFKSKALITSYGTLECGRGKHFPFHLPVLHHNLITSALSLPHTDVLHCCNHWSGENLPRVEIIKAQHSSWEVC